VFQEPMIERMPMPARTITGAALVLALLAAAPCVALAGSDRLPTLSASATLPGGAGLQRARLPLDGYSRATFQVLERSSAATVVLGYPAYETRQINGERRQVRAKPCARTRLTLSLQPPVADPLTYVRQVLPTATTEAVQTDAPFASAPVAAWREFATIEGSRTLRIRAIAARQYTGDVRGLVRLDMQARTVAVRIPCASPSHFTIGPDVESVLTLPALRG
jgi:hypothetical protein